MKRSSAAAFFIAALLAACGGGTPGAVSPNASATCGPPPPAPEPWLTLAYPEPGATNVSTFVGELVFAGAPAGMYDTATVRMAASSGGSVTVAPPYGPAPSPMPTPYATPANVSGNVPYLAAPVPTLSPSTTYTLSYTYTDFNGVPPSCKGTVTSTFATFTTAAGSSSAQIAASSMPTMQALPDVDGYSGQILVPAGSGTATLTLSVDAPSGVPLLPDPTNVPGFMYVAITAQSAFSLSALPGFNVNVAFETPLSSVDFLNRLVNGTWSSGEYGWASASQKTICFAVDTSSRVSLQPGETLYLGMSLDDVLPVPVFSGGPPPCPQRTP